MTTAVKHPIGTSITYMYTFYGMAPVFHDCRSYDEACSWAVTYEGSTARTGGLQWWGVRR
jgi:hypothetical protein